MKFNLIFVSICCLFYLSGCSNAQQDSKVIAEVNKSKLTYNFLMDQFPEEYKTTVTKQQLSNAIETWIETELLYQEALTHNLDKNKKVKNIIDQKIKEIIAFQFVEMSISSDIEIDDAAIDSIYNSQKDQFMVNEDLYELSHIVLNSKNAADAVYSRLQKGDDFVKLVIDYSEDEDSRKHNGDIGYLPESALEKEMAQAIKKLNIGQYTPPIKSQSGYYHIFLLKGKKTAGETLSLDDIREDIVQSFVAQKRQEKYIELLNRLKGLAKIERYPFEDSK